MKRALAVLGTLGVLALSVTPVLAQSRGGARGKVVDEEGNPVPGAKVLLKYTDGTSSTFEVEADENGEYIQIGLQPGGYYFTASREGFVDASLDIRITIGGITTVPDLEMMSVEAARKLQGPDQAQIQEMFNEGVQLAQAADLDGAEAKFNEILEIQPGIPEVYRNLGWIATQRKDWEAAELNYQSALDLRPGDPTFMAALAEVYRSTGRTDEALELMSEAAVDNPDDAKSQFNQGLFLLDGGKTEEAQAAFEAALAADPEMAEAHYHLGTILVGQGKVGESVEHLEAYLASNPDNEQQKATAEGLVAALKAQ